MFENILTVDPGINTGYAYWKGDLQPITGYFNIVRGEKTKSFEKQCGFMWDRFEAVVKTFKPVNCYIESVEQWSGSLKSRTASIKGDLSKLSYLIGGYGHICTKNNVSWILISAKKWKGQLPNKILANRVEHINGQSYINEHVTCAVGIGLSRMGLLSWK